MRSSNKIFLAQHDRTDTYTGKLGFVLDEQTSDFKKWASKSKNPIEEIDNVPIEGFVLNKVKKGHVHEFGRTKDKVRIWDPRGFEVELLNENILRLINDCGIEKGGYIPEKLVYFWKGKGTQVMLLPENSEEYQRFLQGYKTLKQKPKHKQKSSHIEVNKVYSLKGDSLQYYILNKQHLIIKGNGTVEKFNSYIRFYKSRHNNNWFFDSKIESLPKTIKEITYFEEISSEVFISNMSNVKISSNKKLEYYLEENDNGSFYFPIDDTKFLFIKSFTDKNVGGINVFLIKEALVYKKVSDTKFNISKYNVDEKYNHDNLLINEIYNIPNIQEKLKELEKTTRYTVKFK